MKTGFSKTDLTLPYGQWAVLIATCRKQQLLPEYCKKWLVEWEAYDLACSPMDDKARGHIRYGHYLGWFAHANNE